MIHHKNVAIPWIITKARDVFLREKVSWRAGNGLIYIQCPNVGARVISKNEIAEELRNSGTAIHNPTCDAHPTKLLVTRTVLPERRNGQKTGRGRPLRT